MLKNIEFSHLKTFVLLANKLSFSQAAEQLNITQPVLSRKIQRLEQNLGIELFYRTKPRIQLTEAGQIFLGETCQILERLEKAVQTAQKVERGESGEIIVGLENFLAPNFAFALIKGYQKYYPKVRIIFKRLSTLEQIKALQKGEFPVGFAIAPPQTENLAVKTIFKEGLILALPETHPLGIQPDINLEKLANEPFIVDTSFSSLGFERPHSGLSSVILQACSKAGFTPKVAQMTDDLHLALEFVALGMGIALLPSAIQGIEKPGVIYRPLKSSTVEIEIVMTWRSDSLSPILQPFLEAIATYGLEFHGLTLH
ncbi:LysR family transcriptional regulator [Oscillatoriales cyanobacterium LEGE 11467]|uniref:LysR family transcriptional regulator n=1 Tax=Zarconia navalis LEGE 11467 TaxID=1828826 RepID=A0A928VTJ4_9CYAN|nr:LysR substrate-binding domain-containing protein [Zarconia navalis]MBE9039891.1 LysR family transcriptional regulator [Zarconia navalis LEGE 11467]